MDDKFRMKREFELKEGLYFVHGYYLSGWRENDIEELYRDQMILMQDSMDDIYDIDAYDINLREMRMENQIMIPEGEFVYYAYIICILLVTYLLFPCINRLLYCIFMHLAKYKSPTLLRFPAMYRALNF